jgi:GATA-binding protein
MSGHGLAPPNIFENVSLPPDGFGSPSLPAYALRQPSPSAFSINGNSGNLEQPQTYDTLQAQNQQYRTRVNELEVIQELFRSRVDELERNEKEAEEAARSKGEEIERLTADLATANAKTAELQRRVGERDANSSPRKRPRTGGVDEAADG